MPRRTNKVRLQSNAEQQNLKRTNQKAKDLDWQKKWVNAHRGVLAKEAETELQRLGETLYFY
jgi:hypothetical protein